MGKLSFTDTPKKDNPCRIANLDPGEIFKVPNSETYRSIYMVIVEGENSSTLSIRAIDLKTGSLEFIFDETYVTTCSGQIIIKED